MTYSNYGVYNYPATARISGVSSFTPNVKASNRSFKPKINKVKLILAKLIEVLKK